MVELCSPCVLKGCQVSHICKVDLSSLQDRLVLQTRHESHKQGFKGGRFSASATCEATALGSRWPHLKSQDFVDLLISQRLGDAAGRVIPVPDVSFARPVVRDVLVPQLERHLPTSGEPLYAKVGI